MVSINLYPWREPLRLYQKRVLKRMLVGFFILSLMICGIVYGLLLRKEYLARLEIDRIQQELEHYAALQARLDSAANHGMAINALRALLDEQAQTAMFFATLGSAFDSDVCFKSISRTKNKMVLSGYTRSAADLSAFLHDWQAAALFSEIKIEEMEQQEGNMRFSLQAVENAL